MAARRNNYVETARRPQAHSGMYIYGNTVRQNEVMPRRRERVVEEPRRKKSQPSGETEPEESTAY